MSRAEQEKKCEIEKTYRKNEKQRKNEKCCMENEKCRTQCGLAGLMGDRGSFTAVALTKSTAPGCAAEHSPHQRFARCAAFPGRPCSRPGGLSAMLSKPTTPPGWPQCDAIETDYSTRAEDSEHPAGQLIRLEPALSRVLVAVLAEHSGEVDRA